MSDKQKIAPLADRMRPRNLDEFFGQEEILGENAVLRRILESGFLASLIFWGPPGSGKTTLANIISQLFQAEFLKISAVTSGLKDLRKIISEAKANQIEEKKTILFIDEIHRWNKKQQDALLPHVENGLITLIGATTENPGFEIRNALLSRSRVFVLKSLDEKTIFKILKNALEDEERGLKSRNIQIKDDVLHFLASLSNGDARMALNVLEYLSELKIPIDEKIIKDTFQKSHLFYDSHGDEHYNLISALHKSLRGSDENASLYWLARMLEAGEDPLYIARRLVRFASEDVGIANSHALEQAVAGYQACYFIGMPECSVVLSQIVVYLAKCKKSNALYKAYREASSDVKEKGNLDIPLHLRNAPNRLMKDIGYGKDYKYSPDYNYKENQEYFPEKIGKRKYI